MLVRLLFHVVEVTKSLPNLIKYQTLGFTSLDQVTLNNGEKNFVRIIDNNIVGNKKTSRQQRQNEDSLEDVKDEIAATKEEIENAKSEAEHLLKKAEQEADIIIKEAMEKAKIIEEESGAKGYEEGLLQGNEAAKKELEEAKEELRTKYHNKELDLEEEYYDKMKELEPEFAKLTCQLVYKLTGILAEQKQDVIIYIMNRTLREIENSKNFLIKVSEEDYEVVMNRVNEIYGKSNPSISIDILAESKLSKNQCLIETDNGIVDASLEVQLEGLIEDIMLISGM